MSVTRFPFEHLRSSEPDGLLAMALAFRADPRPDKIDLGLGVYRDDAGITPVLRAVKAAERNLLETQDSKVYLGPEGNHAFVSALASLVFGASRSADPALFGLQTPGGTGALRLAAEFLVSARGRGARIWLGVPTWASHVPILQAAGLEVRTFHYFDALSQTLAFDGMIDTLSRANRGDAVLLQAGCHNPTGTDLTQAQWDRVAEIVQNRDLVPLIDFAYQGFGQGLEDDARGVVTLFDRVPTLLVAYSCDKNFGLYRERTGALWVKSPDPALAPLVRGALVRPVRQMWAMPPDHGAAIVCTILGSDVLRSEWLRELDNMRRRIAGLRELLAARDSRLHRLREQRGMFSILPLPPGIIRTLRQDHGLYLADDGRINIAGMQSDIIERFIEIIDPYLEAAA